MDADFQGAEGTARWSEGTGSALPSLPAAELSSHFFIKQDKTTFHVFSP